MGNSDRGHESSQYRSPWEPDYAGTMEQNPNFSSAAVTHTAGSAPSVPAVLTLITGIVACAVSFLLGAFSARGVFSLPADIAVIVVIVVALLFGIVGVVTVVKKGFAGAGMVIAGNICSVLATCAVIAINVIFFSEFTGGAQDMYASQNADEGDAQVSEDEDSNDGRMSGSHEFSASDEGSSSIEDKGWASSSGVYIGGSYIERPSSGIEQLPIVGASIIGPDGSSRPNVQKWFDDLASGNFERMRSYCWTMTPQVREARWFDNRMRGAILEAGSHRGEWVNSNAQWVGTYVTVVFSPEEYASNYPCPIVRIDGKTDALTSADAEYMLMRIVRQIDGHPIARDDDGRYETMCGASSLSSIRATLDGDKESVVRSFESAGSLIVKPKLHSSDSVYYTVSSSRLHGSIELKQNIDNGNFCVNNVIP